MTDNIKYKLSRTLLKRQLKKKPVEQNNFKSFIKNSSTILLIIPENRECWNFLKPIFSFLKEAGKDISIFLPDSLRESFILKRKITPITFNEKDISKLNLPGKSLEEKIRDKSFDIIIDLNIQENLFYSAVANIVKSEFRIGFVKRDSDLYYNFQIPFEINNEFSYRNLLNSLTMF